MYEDRYGTDWETLGTEEAIERAYALGVLSGLDQELPEEYRRVRNEVDSDPEAHMVELAYEEGCQAVADLPDGDRDDRETWCELVDGDDDRSIGGEHGEKSPSEDTPASAPPSSLSALKGPDMDPELFDLPEFLMRE